MFFANIRIVKFFAIVPKKIFVIFAVKYFSLEIIRDLRNYSNTKGLALTIGMFDGVHLGHQQILRQLNDVAKRSSLGSAVLTFWPHPRKFFSADDNFRLLNTPEEKSALLQKFGVENLFIQEFNDDFRNLEAEDFVRKILSDKLNVKHLIIGHDHTFGKNQNGNFDLLKRLAPECGFTTEQIQAIENSENEIIISSTKIRESLQSGNILSANRMLGYAYPLTGRVIHGKKIGRTIGYPTANLEVNPDKLLPKKGAYIVEVFLGVEQHAGMMSIGTNPTVNGQQLTAEVYILNFSGDIYGEDLTVRFRDFLHEEIKFESLEKLIEKLDEDKIKTENFHF